MKNKLFLTHLLLGFTTMLFAQTPEIPICGKVDSLELDNFPSYEITQSASSWNACNGSYSYNIVTFADDVQGSILKGGTSKKYFISSYCRKFYYINKITAIRALYLFERYGCKSDRYKY